MKKLRLIFLGLFTLFLLNIFSGLYAGNIAREFNIFAPPQTDYSGRISFVVVTAVIGNNYVTEVDIIDRNEDGDSDDTHEDLTLTQGQSYIVFISEGDVNDDFGGVMDGDYFKIQANRRIQTVIGTISDWEFDYVPPYFHSDGSVDFFIYVPDGSHADEWGIDVISYKDNTTVFVEDITVTPISTSGYTSVHPIGSGSERWSGTLNRGEDLLIRKDVDVFSGIDPRGRTFYIHADDSVAVITGALRQAHSARDGASYVKNGAGLNVGKEFYFYIPLDEGRNDEKEIRVNTYSEAATIDLWCWNGSQWESLVANESMTAYDHFDYIGSNSAGYSQNFFKLRSTGNVGVFTATWLETGQSGTSDMATYMSSEYGYGAGHNYIVYLGPPGNEDYHGIWSHAYITTIDSNAIVTVKDMDFDGDIIDTSVVLNTNDFFDFKINTTTWNQLNAGDNRPYVKIYSEKEIRVFSSNWNDNWLAFAAGITVPQYSPQIYTNFPYKRWVFLSFPLKLAENTTPDDIFGPYFGGQESNPGEPDINNNWRFSRWNIEHNTYVRWGETDYDGGNHGDPPLPIPGRGYWFYQLYGSAIDLPIYGSEVNTDDDYYIDIDPPIGEHEGLNQVGNPFPFVIDWKNTKVKVTTTSGTQELTLEEANEAGILDSWSYRWNGYEYIAYNYTNGGDFLVWDGFWVEQLDTVIQSQITEYVCYRAVHQANHTGIKFQQCSDKLGTDGAIETDRFMVYVYNGGNVVDVNIQGTQGTSHDFDLGLGESEEHLGFRTTFLNMVVNGNFRIYTFTVKSLGTNPYPLNHVLFKFGSGSYIYSPRNCKWVSIIRTSRGSKDDEDILFLELKIPPTDINAKRSPDFYLNPYASLMDKSSDWFIPLSITNDDNMIRDTYSGFGMMEEAEDAYDKYDARDFNPNLNSFVNLYFPHNNMYDINNYWVLRPIRASYDIRSDFADTTYWDFDVSAWKVPSEKFTIKWDASEIPSTYNLELLDLNQQDTITVNMNSLSSYNITTSSSSSEVLSFQIISYRSTVGVDKEPVPYQFALLDNYPNPFNATTNFRYILDLPGYVSLNIYTVKGELVRTLVADRKEPGSYLTQWNGKDNSGKQVASGVYIYRLATETKTVSKKMVLLK